MAKESSLLDVLLDDNNQDPIELTDENGNTIRYDQVAIIPIDNRLYVILKPLDYVKGIEDDQAILFEYEKELDRLKVIYDEEIIDQVGKIYNDLLNKQGGDA